MSILGYLLSGIGTLCGAWLLDWAFVGLSWLIDYPRRSRLDFGFITRIRWYEKWIR